MTSKDGADHDDDELDQMMGSMRSMWRELPDEEPPSRGLDALMAAARTKAAEMQPREKESWFRRALAMLARPPVLAAATVVVLVGSTVLLTQRDGGDRAVMPTTQTFDEVAPQAAAQKSKQVVKEDGFGDGAGSAVVQGAPAIDAPRPERPTRSRPTIVQRPPVVREAKPPSTPPPPPAEPLPAPERELNVKDAEKPAVIKQNSGEGNAPTAADSIAIETTGGTPAPATARTQTASSEQLLKQAETAASRNDCPAVRATVARIRKSDDRFYRSRVVTQPAIKRCL